MSGENIAIICAAIFGFVPLGIVLYRRRTANRLRVSGNSAPGLVYHIVSNRKPASDIVYYSFQTAEGNRCTGSLTSGTGIYKMHDSIEVFYDPKNPTRNTVKGAWKSNVIVIVMVVIAVFVLIMMYDLYLANNASTSL